MEPSRKSADAELHRTFASLIDSFRHKLDMKVADCCEQSHVSTATYYRA